MKRKIPLVLLCVLFFGMTVYYGFRIYQLWNEDRVRENTYQELTQYVRMETAPVQDETKTPVADDTREEPEPAAEPELTEEPEPTEEPDDTIWPEVDFATLQEINPHVMAWIYMEGTDLSYPVVQGQDNKYYLKHLIDGAYNAGGTIFLDYRSDKGFADRHSLIYGHHMRRGDSMFRPVAQYKEQSFYDEHPECLIITPDGKYKLEFFAGYVTDLNSQAWKMEFASDEEFELWLEEAISQSTFVSTVKPTAQDHVVTLSTCSYEFNNARYVLAGVIKQK